MVVNGMSQLILGEVSTTGAYLLGGVGIFCVGVLAVF
jgi:hypothetical protein